MEPFLGQIILNGANFTPAGWHPCDGSLLPPNQFPALFTLLGTRYGGDGRTTFALPNLPSPDNGVTQYIIAIEGIFPRRP